MWQHKMTKPCLEDVKKVGLPCSWCQTFYFFYKKTYQGQLCGRSLDKNEILKMEIKIDQSRWYIDKIQKMFMILLHTNLTIIQYLCISLVCDIQVICRCYLQVQSLKQNMEFFLFFILVSATKYSEQIRLTIPFKQTIWLYYRCLNVWEAAHMYMKKW